MTRTRFGSTKLVGPDQALLETYVIRLPFPMARRLEDGSLVFWHTPKGLTFWISAKDRKPSDDPLQEWKRLRSPAASDELVERADGSLRYGYRVEEENVDLRQAAFYGFFLDDRTQFLLAAYFDYEDAIGDVIAGWRSIRSTN